MEKISLLLIPLCACGIDGLTSEDVFGLSPHPQVWVTGLVTNRRNGAPVARASVQLEGTSTVADTNGAYRIEGFSVGDVVGSASAQGFNPYPLQLTVRAGANLRDIALDPLECGPWRCGSNERCDPYNGQCVPAATLGGSVISACAPHASLDARITIDQKSICSSDRTGKAYFQMNGLRPGGPQILAVGKINYRPLTIQVYLDAGFNALDSLELMPEGGCSSPPPEDVACTCTDPTCQ